jgi:hypothetical protein
MGDQLQLKAGVFMEIARIVPGTTATRTIMKGKKVGR